MEIEGVNDGASGFVVIVIDSDCGKSTPDLLLLEHINLDLWSEMLAQEVGCRGTTDPCTYNGCLGGIQ